MRHCILLLAAVGLAACGKPFEDRSTGPDGSDPSPREAYYLVQEQDLSGQSTDGQPAPDLTRYGFLVCNPGLDPDEVRAAAPQALVFGYVNSHQVPLWGDDAFWNDYRALFDSTDYWIDGHDQRASTWENTEEMLYTPANAEKLASYVVAHWGGWDGIYVDDCFGSLADIILQRLPATPAEWPQVQADWAVFRDTLIAALQAGTGQPIVGNAGLTAPDIRHLGIQGVCSEEWWPAYTDVLLAEFARYDPDLCVAWEWDAGEAARPGDIRYR